ncbi:MAG: MFS transporter [Chitinophagaceae bacterium]|nr:MAG: MFS transporter [Chitinophagaceae bacterium]
MESNIVTQSTDDKFAAIKIPEFRNLILGRFLFISSLRMLATLIGWWVYQITKEPFAIGLIGLSEVIPALGMALYSGHYVDTHDKRQILLKSVLGYALVVIVLWILSLPQTEDFLHIKHITWFIYGLIFFTGFLRSFVGPSMNSILAFVVPHNILQNATTWNQGTWLSASVTGHAVGGLLIALIGISNTLICIAVGIIVSLLFFYRLKPKPPIKTKKEISTLKSIYEGLQFVYHTKALLGAMSLDMFAVLFGGAVAMIPVYATDILKIGPTGFGWLNAAIDIGAIISVVSLTLAPLKRKQGVKMLIAVAFFGVCIIVFAISKSFILSFLVLVIAGILDGISVVVRGTVMQLLTPDHMRGRVSSVSGMFVLSSNELGQFESGLASKIMGVIPSVVFGGSVTLLVALITWLKAPTLRKFEY